MSRCVLNFGTKTQWRHNKSNSDDGANKVHAHVDRFLDITL